MLVDDGHLDAVERRIGEHRGLDAVDAVAGQLAGMFACVDLGRHAREGHAAEPPRRSLGFGDHRGASLPAAGGFTA
jgi:hypothetical protein